MRSFIHFVRVGLWSVRTCAPHSTHSISPRPEGSKPLHFGQESDGGAILDSTVNCSSMMFHPVFDFGLFGYQIANLLIRRYLSLSPQELVFQGESSKANPTGFCILEQVSGQVALLRLVLLNR